MIHELYTMPFNSLQSLYLKTVLCNKIPCPPVLYSKYIKTKHSKYRCKLCNNDILRAELIDTHLFYGNYLKWQILLSQ